MLNLVVLGPTSASAAEGRNCERLICELGLIVRRIETLRARCDLIRMHGGLEESDGNIVTLDDTDAEYLATGKSLDACNIELGRAFDSLRDAAHHLQRVQSPRRRSLR